MHESRVQIASEQREERERFQGRRGVSTELQEARSASVPLEPAVGR
jgi:hypothetical protein